MKQAIRFSVQPGWKLLLSDIGIDPVTVLTMAGLPTDLFKRTDSTLTAPEYFRLWQGMELAAGEKELPLLLAQALSVEQFDPPLFSAICSPNLNTALKRLSNYKRLIGPMILNVEITGSMTTATIDVYGNTAEIPRSLGASELVFFTQLTRIATRQNVRPISAVLTRLPEDTAPYEEYFGCKLTCGDRVSVSFSSHDATLPFLTSNAAMWNFFEEKLNKKLSQLDSDATTSERVRSVLIEILPGGESSIEVVASRLAMSKRTLQRKLSSEHGNFQFILQGVREELADHYLSRSQMSLGEISFLLGFQESNSFIRAFSNWKGISPGAYRELAG